MFDLLNHYNVFLNFLSFGSMLVTFFTFFFAVFFFTIRNRSPYTTALAQAFLFFGFFNLGYWISAMIYHPAAAAHRFLTLGFVYPSLLYIVQFQFLFPESTHPKIRKLFLFVQWAIGFVIITIFYFLTRNVEYKFHFTGHYWDYDAEYISRIGAYFIMLFVLLIAVVGIWRIILLRKNKKYRNALIIYTISVLVGAVVPAILNTMSRDGAVDRGVYINALVIFEVLAFFAVVILYINVTEDRTTFMAKIVGITIVTFLLLMQGLAYITLGDKEKEYDALRIENLEKAIKAEIYPPEMVYLLKYDLKNHEYNYLYSREDYFKASNNIKIPFEYYLSDLENTAFYERIKNYEGKNFKEYLEKELSNSPENFIAYKISILDFLKNYPEKDNEKLKQDILSYFDKLNKLTFVHYNRITFIHDESFRKEVIKYLDKTPKEFRPFAEVIKQILKDNQDASGKVLKLKIYQYLAPLRPQKVRQYRASEDRFTHYVSYIEYDLSNHIVYEGGFRYIDYRAFIHKSALQQTIIFLIIFFVVTVIYPLFFRGSLIKPLDELLDGVKKVNRGDLTVKVPVFVQDEIGYLATSFNKMVDSIREAKEQLQDYANHLEDKVRERTAELNASLEEVRRLKQMQDGDYYLTSLLQKPLMLNFNKSKRVPTEFIIKQYKEFEFRGKTSEIGGDICVTGNLRLGKSLETAKRYIVAMNGDAMGKSTQGAGGALVMGVVMNAIIARSARHDRVLDMTPEEWITEVYEEIHGVFSAFNGTMCISCVVDLIDEETGKMYYFNAEHPFQVLYRNGKASFIEEELKLRKLGLASEYPFEVQTFQLEPGDIVIAGSDGRDDIEIGTEEGIRIINEDEYLFLQVVEEANGDLQAIYAGIKKRGKITDDISLLKIHFVPVEAKTQQTKPEATSDQAKREKGLTSEKDFIYKQDQTEPTTNEKIQVIVLDEEDPNSVIEEMILENNEFDVLIEKGNEALNQQNYREALEYFSKAYEIDNTHKELNKKLAVLTFKLEDYEKAVKVLEKYLDEDPYVEDFWLYLSIAHKKRGNYNEALETAEKAYELNQKRIPILLQLADVHFHLQHIGRANIFLEKVFELDPDNEQAKRLKDKIERYMKNMKSATT